MLQVSFDQLNDFAALRGCEFHEHLEQPQAIDGFGRH